MWWKGRSLKAIQYLLSAALLAGEIAVSGTAMARDFSAGIVMTEMSPKDRYTFIAGVIEGLAYARFAADDKQTDGMACIYRWFYETEGAFERIEVTFIRYDTHLPGAVLAAMIQKRCP